MRVPYGWLAELVEGLPDLEKTTELLAGLGLGVEVVEKMPAAPSGVRVVQVVEVADVPGAQVRRAVVDDGVQRRTVACGAPNLTLGMRSAYAPPGTMLPGMDQAIVAREMAGFVSDGMLCSPRELGLFDHAGGLLVLGDDAKLGAELAELWPAEQVIELELTPNRADAFSLLGVARDLCAKLGTTMRHPASGSGVHQGDAEVDDGLRLVVSDAERCPRFYLRRIDGITVKPSPLWLQRRLAHLGSRPRNAVVDITNLVTFELGQPSHAYDLDVLDDGILEVRRARQGEQLVTLTGEALTLEEDDLVIATGGLGGAGSRAIGLAGVIGGLDDSVSERTTAIALEVASFEPTGVRRTARRHKQVTDARIRFERGVDPALPPLASARIVELLLAVSDGRPDPGLSRFETGLPQPSPIAYRPGRVHDLMDFEVSHAEQLSHLTRLGCKVEAPEGGPWTVWPPSWRMDIAIEEDLVEEVARLHGYEHVGTTAPRFAFVPPATDPIHRLLRERLVGAGLLETIGYAFVAEDDLARARVPASVVHLVNPQGQDRAVLRTSLLPGLLAAARGNRDAPSLALFEIGRVFREQETEQLAILWRGERAGSRWRAPYLQDAFVAKGMLESLAAGMGARLELRQRDDIPHLHPGVGAELWWDGVKVGSFGRLHPEVALAWGCGDVFVAEIALPLPSHPPRLTELPRQPFAERDLAVVVPQALSYEALRGLCSEAAGPRLVELFPFDVYQGPQLGEGMKSLNLRFRFRHPQRALTDAEVDADMTQVMNSLEKAGYAPRT